MARKMKWSIRLLIVLTLVLVLGILAIAPQVLRFEQVPGSNKLWYVSEAYCVGSNESFAVVFHSVEFTFQYEEGMPLDAPIPIHFMVAFSDGTVENLTTSIGGWLMQPPRVVMTNHTNPQAAIVSAYDDAEEWYSWYYAVSLD